MATHSSIPAWKIPWTEEPERLVHRVTKSQTQLSMHTCMHYSDTVKTIMKLHSFALCRINYVLHLQM